MTKNYRHPWFLMVMDCRHVMEDENTSTHYFFIFWGKFLANIAEDPSEMLKVFEELPMGLCSLMAADVASVAKVLVLVFLLFLFVWFNYQSNPTDLIIFSTKDMGPHWAPDQLTHFLENRNYISFNCSMHLRFKSWIKKNKTREINNLRCVKNYIG